VEWSGVECGVVEWSGVVCSVVWCGGVWCSELHFVLRCIVLCSAVLKWCYNLSFLS
jgi:hypothetical protein